jgi:hypothetical protein
MIADTIRERLEREPFEPFRIRSSSGKAYLVGAPYLIALMKSKVFIAMPKSDRWVELSYLHVAAVESVTNGQSKRPPRGRREH